MLTYNKYKNKNFLNNQNYIISNKYKTLYKIKYFKRLSKDSYILFDILSYFIIHLIKKIIINIYEVNLSKGIFNIIITIFFLIFYFNLTFTGSLFVIFLSVIYLYIIILFGVIIDKVFMNNLYVLGIKKRKENKFINFTYSENLNIRIKKYKKYKKYRFYKFYIFSKILCFLVFIFSIIYIFTIVYAK